MTTEQQLFVLLTSFCSGRRETGNWEGVLESYEKQKILLFMRDFLSHKQAYDCKHSFGRKKHIMAITQLCVYIIGT